MTARRQHVIDLLLDLDLASSRNPDVDIADWRHKDGRRFTSDEIHTLIYATPEEWRTVREVDLLRRSTGLN